ncbi:hypothetical protein PC128_g9643 [Phytophthora cactorum]|nr:hypothetical protein PC128_g9643 [Phytophthora cactorum]
MCVSAQRLCTRPGVDVAMPGIAAINKKRAEPVGAGRPTGSEVTRVYNGHATLKTAAPSEKDSYCKKQDDKPNLVNLKIWSKRENSLRALVDSGASNNFVRQQSLPKLNFEEVDTPRSVLEVRLAMGATGRTEKRVVRVRFSYKHRVFVENLIVLDLDDKFDLVLSMSWLARHDPVVNWEKRTLVRFGRNTTESDAPVSVAHAPQVASDHTVEAAPCVAASGAHTQVTTTEAVVESVSNQKSDLRCIPTSTRVSTLEVDRLSMEETSATSSSCKVGVSASGVDTEGSAARRRGVKEHQLRELMTRQAVLAITNVQHRKSLRARVQPSCTTKRYAIKPGLIVSVRGKNPPTVTKLTETRPSPGLDEEQVEPGSTKRNDSASNTSCASLGQGPRRYKRCLPGRHQTRRRVPRR